MDAVKFISELNKMCLYYEPCSGCPLNVFKNSRKWGCTTFLKTYPRTAVKIVEKWSKEHSQKTICDDFKEKYPNAKLDGDHPMLCPSILGFKLSCDDHRICNPTICWNTPLEQAQQQDSYEEDKNGRKIRW